MNKVMLMGRLTRDPEVRYSASANGNNAFAHFSIAVDRRFKREGQPDADFFNCTAFGKQAEFVEKYLRKGTKMLIIGSIQNDNYTDRDGNQRYSVQIMVEEMEFAESKAAQQNNGDNGGFQPQGGQTYGSTGNGANNGNKAGNGYNNNRGGNQNYGGNGGGFNSGFNGNNRGFGNGGGMDGFMNIPDGVEDEDLPFN